MKSALSTIAVLSVFSLVGVAEAGLKVGDPAPKLSISDWVKGSPVDPTKAKPEEVFVVEFWATWCGPCRTSMPHMSKMQEHFRDRGVTFIGISSEAKNTVEKFLKKGYDSKMRYTVAIDSRNQTNKDWMQAAGQKGIPCAFVVKGGTIRWIGHPMSGLDTQVAKLCGDTDYAERQKLRKALDEKIQEAASAENWEEVLSGVNGILEIEPGIMSYHFAKYHLLVAKLKKTEEASRVGRAIVKDCEEAERLNEFAWGVLTNEELDGARDLELALASSKKAMRLSEEKLPSVIDTYARALADTGDLNGAIRWQTKAIELCTDKPMVRVLEQNLASFKERAEKESA